MPLSLNNTINMSLYLFELPIWYNVQLCFIIRRPSWLWSYRSWTNNTICNKCLSPLTLRVRIPIVARCTLKKLRETVCRWLASGQLVFPGTAVSSTNITDRSDITEILLKVALHTGTHANPKPFCDYAKVYHKYHYNGV